MGGGGGLGSRCGGVDVDGRVDDDVVKCVSRVLDLVYGVTVMCLEGKNLCDLTIYVNSELQKIANWFRSNKMAVNTSKTKFIIFRTREKRIDPEDCQLVFNSNEIGSVENPNLIVPIARIHDHGEETSFKLLGVKFDEYLSFDAHISSVCAKISKSLYLGPSLNA